MVCGLDGVYIAGVYKGRMVEESTANYWRPVMEAYAGKPVPSGELPLLIGWEYGK